MTPEQIEVHRKRFEDWFRKVYMYSPLEREGDRYTSAHANLKWIAWLAAIDSVVIELPENVTEEEAEICCRECGSESMEYLEQYANGDEYKCRECGTDQIW